MGARTSDLIDFYYDELHGELEGLEAERKRLLRNLSIVALITAAAFVAYVIYADGDILYDRVYTVLFVALPVVFVAREWMSRSYRKRFKQEVFGRIVARVDPSLSYEPEGKVPEALFVASGLFGTRYDTYRGSDLIRGKIGETPIRFSNLKVKKRKGDDDETIFAGTFIVTEFHKHFTHPLAVMPDVAERYLGVIGSWMQNAGARNLVRLDSPRFEKYFKVYSDDAVEAHYLLTPNLMEKIVELRERAGADLYLSFRYDKLFIAIANGGRWFEPSLFRSLLRLDIVKGYIENLQLLLGIVEELNLNRRIWSKE
ncbi:DUF3137 domain-containing protein [Hydrogenimonas sp. SS33]|uniref:DUF3137 domain-containing protein n=1 Tax=Hydrogenimonas leucolamina TaxID=2954236 RepID=UPI00336BCE3A